MWAISSGRSHALPRSTRRGVLPGWPPGPGHPWPLGHRGPQARARRAARDLRVAGRGCGRGGPCLPRCPQGF
eukprot:788959-Alexandrium_andersonii.AAC.1